MVRDVRFITLNSSYRELQEMLLTGQLKTLALVESRGEKKNPFLFTLTVTPLHGTFPVASYLSPPAFPFRLHDPAGLHRATAAPVSALYSARRPAEAGVPLPAGPGQWHSGPFAQPDHRQHAQLALRPHPQQCLHQHQRSPSGPLPGEHPTGVTHPGVPGLGWGEESGLGWGCRPSKA